MPLKRGVECTCHRVVTMGSLFSAAAIRLSATSLAMSYEIPRPVSRDRSYHCTVVLVDCGACSGIDSATEHARHSLPLLRAKVSIPRQW